MPRSSAATRVGEAVSEERLQKLLARAGVASRRKVEEMIRAGRVTVNGQVAVIGDKADLERDAVKLDDRRVQPLRGHRYLLLNKPRGVMSTLDDPAGRPTVIDLVPPPLRRALVPVGRLDFLTEGLLLLTDDGELAQRIAHPRKGCAKTYEVKVRGRPDARQLERLRAGILLEGRRTAPCRITPRRSARRDGAGRSGAAAGRGARAARDAAARSGRGAVGGEGGDNSWWLVELGEGRTRQIREMFQRIGHPVQKLRRIAIGPVSDPNLPPGALRELSDRELAALRRAKPLAARPPGRGAGGEGGGDAGTGPRKAARPGHDTGARGESSAPRAGTRHPGGGPASRSRPRKASTGPRTAGRPGRGAGAGPSRRAGAGPGRRGGAGPSRRGRAGGGRR